MDREHLGRGAGSPPPWPTGKDDSPEARIKPDYPLRDAVSRVIGAGIRAYRAVAGRIGARLRGEPLPARRTRLVSRILLLAAVWALGVYLLTIAGLWLTSSFLVQDNLRLQSSQWLNKLGDMGMPLYLSDNPSYLLDVENHLKSFPEIAYVRYLGPNGDEVIAQYHDTQHRGLGRVPLDAGTLAQLEDFSGAERPRVLGEHPADPRLYRAIAPLWIESVALDGMLGFQLEDDTAAKIEVIGFVEAGLDFSQYREELARTSLIGSVLIALFFLVTVLIARQVLKHSLSPLSALTIPLKKLAQGDTNVRMESTGDEEIAAICDAFNTTVSALQERDQRLTRMANFDALTGLMNRAYFIDQLEHELAYLDRQGGSSALFFIDLDKFKAVNDTLGHAAGDRLLIKVSEVLQQRVREQDILARFGGDEFTLLARHVRRPEAERIAQSVVDIMRNFHFVEDNQSFDINCSLGVTLVEARPFSAEELLSQADEACHAAKASGRNQFRFHEVSRKQKEQINLDVGLSRKIRDLLARDGFVLEYQPVVELETGHVAMYEVLIRMTGDLHSTIPPGAFLPSADRFGLMDNIDRWVIAHATEQLKTLHAGRVGLPFSINLAATSVEDPALAEYILEQLDRHQLAAESIIFEISEEAALRLSPGAIRRLQILADRGVRFALDAFGSGFSSFGWFRSLPVSFIKIDGHLIHEARRDPIMASAIRAIIDVSHTSGREVVAMRVEDQDTLDALVELGADYAQGFALGRPARAPVAEAAIRPRKRRARR